jgi:photosystem II stability/assembly factor-like uncharacterized protein
MAVDSVRNLIQSRSLSQPANRRRFSSRIAISAITGLLIVLIGSSVATAQDSDEPEDPTPGINSGLLSSLKFRGIGPAMMSGRIGDVVVDPEKRSTWYIAACSGGVWKTTNAGVTWKPIFDNQGSYSIGCLAIDPNDRFTIWVGTGENNSQRSVGYGDGLYKSTNGGSSFKKVGLGDSEHIGKIVVHPDDSNTVYVAAQGPLWSEGGDRGLYKTTDGGESWDKILDISENTGINEVHLDPTNPDIMYASSYQRRRHTWVLIDGGPESGIHKSIDGGETWKKINSGLPGGDKGRIGMAISPINPEVIYAVVEATGDSSGFYRSANRGETWSRMGDYVSGSPQYYQEIAACPHKFDRIYSLDTYVQVSEDGGKTFTGLGEADKHVDNHAIVIDPDDEDHLIVGCDGGLYESWDRGKTYDFKANLPLTQFYKVAVSNEEPFYYVYGGTQDNATQGGPSETNSSNGILNSDWFVTVFGDGFDPAVDPEDPDTIYSQWQYGGLVRFDRKTGTRVDIKPQPSKDGDALRWNWDSALLISPHNHERIYYGSQILFASDDRGNSWTAISEDLSRNLDRNKLKVMGRVWGVDAVAKNMSTSMYGTIVSVSESPLVEGLIYVGTDDGMFQVTEDGGENWRAVSAFGNLDIPEYGYINDIEADVHDADTVYVAVNNHKRGDFQPYIVKSIDRGKTWVNISSDLPERGSVYALKQDHEKPEILFCGTEFGCFTTLDGGDKWLKLSSGLPTIAIRDIEIQKNENDLVLASFGRGFYILDDYSPLRKISEELLEKNEMMPITKGRIFNFRSPMAMGGRAFQGASFYTAPNPDYGVKFTYHLKDKLETAKQKRKSAEKKLDKSGGDVTYPSWDDFKKEDREVAPRVTLTIRDEDGNVVDRIKGSTSNGLHTAVWDMNHADEFGRGAIALPGSYTVDVSQTIDGHTTELIAAEEFEIEPISFAETSEPDREAIMAFVKKAQSISNVIGAASSVTNEAKDSLDEIKSLLNKSTTLDESIANDVRELEVQLMDIQEVFNGDPTRPRRNESALPGLRGRLRTAMFGAMGSREGPTGTHKQQLDIAVELYGEVESDLRKLVEKDIPKLQKKLDKAGAPWTKGRKIPSMDEDK